MKYLIIPLVFVFLATSVFGATLDATLNPSTSTPNGDLKLTIQTSGVPNSKWFVAYDIILEGGCVRKETAQTKIGDFMLDEVSVDQNKVYNIQAPNSDGSCNIEVSYEFTGDSLKTAKVTAEILTPIESDNSKPTETLVEEKPVEPKEMESDVQEDPKADPNSVIIGVVAISIIGLLIYLFVVVRNRYVI